jgi:hypothetical protein
MRNHRIFLFKPESGVPIDLAYRIHRNQRLAVDFFAFI